MAIVRCLWNNGGILFREVVYNDLEFAPFPVIAVQRQASGGYMERTLLQ